MPAPLVIYHNASCSKSEAALQLLIERGTDFTIRNYLEEPLTADELRELLKKLDLPASAIVRRGEALASQLTTEGEPDEDAWIEILAANPSLIERPIIEGETAALVARPPERALEVR